MSTFTNRRHLACPCLLAALLPGLLSAPALRAEPERVWGANYKQAFKYSPDHLRQFVYDTAVVPNWIGKTDCFWYQYRTSKGTRYWRVDPRHATRTPLFDAARLAAALSEVTHKPVDADQLPLTRVAVNDEWTTVRFVVDDWQYEYDPRAEQLTRLGKAPPAPPPGGGRGGGSGVRRRQDDGQQRGAPPGAPRRARESRVFSPDRKAYVFVRGDNLYLLESPRPMLDGVVPPVGPTTLPVLLGQVGAMLNGDRGPRDGKEAQLSTDGTPEYSFGRMSTSGDGMDDEIGPPRAEWSADARAFYASRVDTRGVQELFLVNSLATPRPTLEKYKYPMPGEAAPRRMELFVCDRAARKLIRVAPKYRDEVYSDLHWGKTGDELRFVRRDRLWRHAELCSTSVRTGQTRCLVPEEFEDASVATQPAQDVDGTGELVWWSERSGWGHYYLYDHGGRLKNPVTQGAFRAGRVHAVDPKGRLLYFEGNGREPGENVYYRHLYRVGLDGTGLTLMDPGDGDHRPSLSPSRRFLVDNCDRVDMATVAVLRDADGREVLRLEEADLSRLRQFGWQMPERFTVKAADGVTDVYGNLYKPFDFDPRKKYPVIVHCYPGPQTEGVTHTFSPINGDQQLAQLGFIVVQVGHRGGAPNRSKAYASYGYLNLRDYGLADKKAAVEQLAARHPFIDVDRVGIYGHSGGGFMSAAALLQKPYNEFFKAAVASSGNHDNNIYNNGWAERYHGMKEVEVAAGRQAVDTRDGRSGTDTAERRLGGADQDDRGTRSGEDARTQDRRRQRNTGGGDEKSAAGATRFEIKVPTNAELAANLKGALLLVHGEMDNNVHPANTMRLVDALIKANKRFDMLILPGKRHGFGDYQGYFQQRMWDFFADHLLGDRQTGADVFDKQERHR
jgi:dipeptidyl aminopeptidase/acylaminoacyl peptidase